jgi:hypothetical protein
LSFDAGGDFLGTAYQEEKFQKHTKGDPTAPVNSTFDDEDRGTYQLEIARALDAGSCQVDQFGRRNIFYAANRPTGTTATKAGGEVTVSGLKIVLPDEQAKIHAFPYGSPEIPTKRCSRCGEQIPW